MTIDYYDRTPDRVRINGDGEDEWIETNELLALELDIHRIEGEAPSEWIEFDDELLMEAER